MKTEKIVYEGTEIESISCDGGGAVLTARVGTIASERVILATNGFEKFRLCDKDGKGIDRRFHKNVSSRLAYMLGLFIPGKAPEPASVAYVHEPDAHDPGISYTYVTERPYSMDGTEGTLIAIGGPDSDFNHERMDYSNTMSFSHGVETELERELLIRYGGSVEEGVRFLWHGIMGYTETYARLVGTDPHGPALGYNLGCNGVGILLSIWGGNRIAEGFLGRALVPTMFDPVAHFGR